MKYKKEFTKEKADFENFLIEMDEQLDWLFAEATKYNFNLNLSEPCYEKLESLFDLMVQGKSKDEILKISITFARFLGENIRTLHGGKWHLFLDDENNVYFNTPVIVGHSPIKDLEFSPLFTMRAYALRRKKGTLLRAIDAQINIVSLNLEDIGE